ncbi:sigma-70 family RNA polymerase sigma factor [Kribbella soli]
MAVVVRAQVGDREAVAELVRGWHGPVWGYVRQMLGRDDVADDVPQEVWLGVVRGLPRLKQPDRFAAWLFTIARRSVINQLRDKYAGQPQPTQYEEPDPADHVVDRLDVRRPVRPCDAGRCPLHRRAEETIGATVKPIGPLAIALRRFGTKQAGIAIAALLIVLLVVGLLI